MKYFGSFKVLSKIDIVAYKFEIYLPRQASYLSSMYLNWSCLKGILINLICLYPETVSPTILHLFLIIFLILIHYELWTSVTIINLWKCENKNIINQNLFLDCRFKLQTHTIDLNILYLSMILFSSIQEYYIQSHNKSTVYTPRKNCQTKFTPTHIYLIKLIHKTTIQKNYKSQLISMCHCNVIYWRKKVSPVPPN